MNHLHGADFASLASGLDRARLLVVGDAMLDRFVAGAVERISPEAPIPVLRVERRAEMPGGAGNVVANLLALGARVAFVAVVGDDEAGRVLAEFPAAGFSGDRLERALVVEAGRPTTIKTRFVAGTQQLLRIDEETTAPISTASEEAVLRAVENHLGQAGAVVLSDYGKGVLTPRVCQGIVKLARAAKVPVLVDPKGADYTRYDGATAVTPNRRELEQAAGRSARHDDEVEQAARGLIAKHHFDALIATRSEQGLSVVRARDAHHVPARAREIFDVSGAGDTVMATLAAAVAIGADLVDAATLANEAGGVAVAKPGTATVSRDELLHALELGDETKLLARDGAAGRVETWRRRGLKVAFTNGCFDLLHPGHVHLLRQARATADRLIVGLNSDASVQRLKGPTRPVNDERARAQVLASLADVDAVVVFDEDTPMQLLESLRPDVLVKGADYTIDQIVGADLVQSYGGRIVRAELVPDQSTTRTIARMAQP